MEVCGRIQYSTVQYSNRHRPITLAAHVNARADRTAGRQADRQTGRQADRQTDGLSTLGTATAPSPQLGARLTADTIQHGVCRCLLPFSTLQRSVPRHLHFHLQFPFPFRFPYLRPRHSPHFSRPGERHLASHPLLPSLVPPSPPLTPLTPLTPLPSHGILQPPPGLPRCPCHLGDPRARH